MRGFSILALIVGIFLFTDLIFAENTDQPVCGYDSCPKTDPKKLNVHMIPYTINIIGYTATLNAYYNTHVKHQIDSIIDSLQKNPARRFSYVDVVFLNKWWSDQNETRREALKALVKEGRFEIANGGWTINDEVVTNYQSIIDHFTLGFKKLNETLGSCARPKVGWQIGSYGHSREHASLMAQMGFDGTFISLVDPSEKLCRYAAKSAEFIWNTSPNLGKDFSLFASILHHAATPRQYCYDVHCAGRIPIIDDINDINYNVKMRATHLMNIFKDTAKKYKTNNINFVLGGTNSYSVAELWYTNFDKIIRYINEKSDTHMNVFYSTPSCYLKSLNEQNTTWPERDLDFLPYAPKPHSYLTGYYTSKPSIKYLDKLGNEFLRVIKQLSVLTEHTYSKELDDFQEMIALMQNMHVVTGNHISKAGQNYIKNLYDNFQNTTYLASKALNKLTLKKQVAQPPEFHSCLLLNISACKHTADNEKFVVTVYNPTSQPLFTYVRVPVQKGSYVVRDSSGNEVVTQLVLIPEPVLKVPGRVSNATMELVFLTENISALSYESFYVNRNNTEVPNIHPTSDRVIGNNIFNISVNSHGKIHIKSLTNPKDIEIQQSFHYYESANGHDPSSLIKVSSGAVIFRPQHSHPKELNKHNHIHVYKGPLVEEIHQTVNDWVSQVVRVYNYTDTIEFEWMIGPIPAEKRHSKEVITRYSSNLKTHSEFYTDSNGREMIKRKLKSNLKTRFGEPVSANFYPINSKISVEDKQKKIRMSVFVDRAEGGSSLSDGEIELMLHRRVMTADHIGVGIPTNELAYRTGVVSRGSHVLVTSNLTDLDEAVLFEKELLNSDYWLFFTPTLDSFEEWRDNYKMKGESPITNLPNNVRILTLEPWKDGEILLRLEHIFEVNETTAYSTTAQVDLKDLFVGFTVVSIDEMTLGANRKINETHRLKWQQETRPRPAQKQHRAKRSPTTERESETIVSSNSVTAAAETTVSSNRETTSTETTVSSNIETAYTETTIPSNSETASTKTSTPVSPNISSDSSTESLNESTPVSTTQKTMDSYIITLNPMQIRTFILKIAHGVKSTTTTSSL